MDDWETTREPYAMLQALDGRASARKLRLLLVGCTRVHWDELHRDDLQLAVTVAERFADGEATEAELTAQRGVMYGYYVHGDEEQRAWIHAGDDRKQTLWGAAFGVTTPRIAVRDLRLSSGWHFVSRCGEPHTPDLFRCIFGNPFRPVALDPAWRTEAVVALAAGIYEERAFERLPVLADALDDAGCADADVLAHCRGPGPHARGCWVVDLILGMA